MSVFESKKRKITCQDTGHECALKSLQDQGLITQAQYNCLIKVEGFCVPGIGTNPSKILELLNGVPIIDANGDTINCMDDVSVLSQIVGINFGNPMESYAATHENPEKLWLRFDCSRIEIPVGISNIAEAILHILFTAILTSPVSKSASRLVLNLGEGTDGHFSVFYGGDNSYIIDPFDPNRNSVFLSRKKIPFAKLPIQKNQYIFFLVDINELIPEGGIRNREQLMNEYYGRGIDLLDIEGCKHLEAITMANLTQHQRYCIANPGYLPDNKQRRGGGGKRTKKQKRKKQKRTRKSR